MISLTGKTAVVTGASRGIGKAIAIALADAGAQVIVHYCTADAAATDVVTAIRSSGGTAEKVAMDLSRADGPRRLAQRVRTIIGARLDILVANAGISYAATIEQTSVDAFDRLFALNVRAPFFLVQQLQPVMCKGSNVVLLSSLAARASADSMPAYASTKGAIETLVKHFAQALGHRGIRVNAVAPGGVETDLSNRSVIYTEAELAHAMQALKRFAQPDDISAVVAFLASDEARWITGNTLSVDGGAML